MLLAAESGIMSSLPRFYLPPSAWLSQPLMLDGDEAHHCLSVMRRGVGDRVEIFDGAGRYATAQITAIEAKKPLLQIEEEAQTPQSPVQLSLLQAIPKGSNMELIIEKAVELGVNHIYPIMSQRTVVQISGKDAAKKQQKWQRLVLEACKQCRQNWLPEVHEPMQLDRVWAVLPEHDLRLVAAIQPDAQSIRSTVKHQVEKKGQYLGSALVMIGPEGDYTPDEYTAARAHGCIPITLGSIILRVETATLFCLSVIKHELGEEAAVHKAK